MSEEIKPCPWRLLTEEGTRPFYSEFKPQRIPLWKRILLSLVGEKHEVGGLVFYVFRGVIYLVKDKDASRMEYESTRKQNPNPLGAK